MFLVRLVYTSKLSDTFSSDDITEILASARKHNSRNHVTGLLCFSSNYFLQCIEGSRSAINRTYHRILNDPRHEAIVMLDYKEINRREFSHWHMGYVPYTALTRDVNMLFSGSPEFNPYEMSGESAHQLMLALKDTVDMV